MTGFSAAELLARHNIAFRQTRTGKYSTACPDCNGEGYLDVKIDDKGVQWHCQSCKQGKGEYFEQYDERSKPTVDFSNPKAVYDYVDESGARLFQVVRIETDTGLKEFRQRTGPDQEKWSIKGVRIVPYRLPELVEDVALGSAVFVVEGEKDVDTLRRRGIPATCKPMGARSGGRSSTRFWLALMLSFAATMMSPGASMPRSSRATCGPSSSGCGCWIWPRSGLKSRKAKTYLIGSRPGSMSGSSSP